MLTHAYEFIRIADASPEAAKVTKRKEAATELTGLLSAKQNREILLGCVQGVIAGFGTGFAQDSPVVATVLNAVQGKDAAFPHDLTENSQELRACAAIAVGEVLLKPGDKESAVAAALAFRSALGVRPAVKEKHAQFAIEKLQGAAEELLASVATSRRLRSTAALKKLLALEQPADAAEVWKAVMPAMRAAVREVHAQGAADREEIDSLWWMFQRYSEIAKKALDAVPPPLAALCAGIELAERALVPPIAANSELVKRAIEAGRKPADLQPLAISDVVATWSHDAMLRLAPADGAITAFIAQFPGLLPVSRVCRRRIELGKFTKEATNLTGLSSQKYGPAEWGEQIFHERVLQRVLVDTGS